ncbi:hypothetical protein [Ahrensia kielensis]|uniref:hypothetical protein n=1 Tax=Ahrensia kielensis TaxID=76980 RepID=UPI003CCC6482
MTNKTTNKYSPELRERSVRMVLEHESAHVSRWAAIVSIADKIGRAPQTLNDWSRRSRSTAASVRVFPQHGRQDESAGTSRD